MTVSTEAMQHLNEILDVYMPLLVLCGALLSVIVGLVVWAWRKMEKNQETIMKVMEVHASGRKTFYFRYRDARNIVRQPKLSDANDISLKQVRQLADKYRQQLAMDIDPFAAKENLKKAPTLKNFIDESYMPYIKTYTPVSQICGK